MSTKAELHEFIVFSETRKCWVVGTEPLHAHTDDAIYLPKKVCRINRERTVMGLQYKEFVIPEWLCREKNLDIVPPGEGEIAEGWEEFDDDDEDLIE